MQATSGNPPKYFVLFHSLNLYVAQLAYCSLRNEMKRNEMERNEMEICSLRNGNL